MTTKKKMIAVLTTGVAVIVAAIVWFSVSKGQAVEINYEMTYVEPDTLRNTITATGTIEPVTKVAVGTQVSGIVSKLYVDYNSEVKKGEIIAELDKVNLESELKSSKANFESAKSKLDYEKANFERYKTLFEKGLISRNDFQTAELSYRQAHESYLIQKEMVNKAQTNLSYATITSPIDGIVLSKSVEEGQTVAASFSTPTLFTIAQDLTDMRVIANVDEADIGEVQQGQRVTFTVDAYPNDVFEGHVTQVRQEATTSSNVVTYEVVISAPNDELKLKPGLTANVTIQTLERFGVLSVRSKALRFTPTVEVVGKHMKIVDCAGKNKLWSRNGNSLVAHSVELGVSDGTRVEIKSGIVDGTEVIMSVVQIGNEAEASTPEGVSPFIPRRNSSRKK